MVFASPSGQFYHDGTTWRHLPGLSHLDKFIWTRKLTSIYWDFAKTHANPDTDGNSLYHRAVICKANCGQVFTVPGLPMRKQEFGNPSLQPSLRCQTHASLPTRTSPSGQFYLNSKFYFKCQDFGILTTLT